MTIEEAQDDLRSAFVGGWPGVVVSGVVWLVAGVMAQQSGTPTGFAVLFVGGMLIFPLSLLVVRTGFRRAAHSTGNPMAALTGESTVALITGLVAAYLLLRHDPALVFPVAALAVGARYFLFRTAYRDRTYWILGGLICAIGGAAIMRLFPFPGEVALAVGLLEVGFGMVCTMRHLRLERG